MSRSPPAGRPPPSHGSSATRLRASLPLAADGRVAALCGAPAPGGATRGERGARRYRTVATMPMASRQSRSTSSKRPSLMRLALTIQVPPQAIT